MIARVQYDFAPVLEESENDSHPTKWDVEKMAFFKKLPELLAQGHRGKYAAVHDGEVVAIGGDDVALALESYTRFGYREIYIGWIVERQPVSRISSPIVVRKG